MADTEQNGSKKKLNELRVVDLRGELEKRGLDRNGVKTALLERLTKALEDEGNDPNEFLFDVAAEKTPSKVPVKRSSRKLKENDSEVTNEEEDEEEEKQVEDEESKESVKEAPKDAANDEKKEDSDKTEEQEDVQCNGDDIKDGASSPNPKPENAPVINPLTVEDVIKLDTSSKLKASDNDSMIVNPDDTQSDIDSSITEKDSVCEENVQEETANNNNSVKEDAKPEGGESVKTEDDNKADAKEETKPKKEPNQESTITSSNNQTEKESPEKGKAAKTGSDSAVSKSSPEKSEAFVKAKSIKRVAASSKNLWVSGLAEKTRANDLKALFSKFGKVSGAKIVTNAKTPGARCYGFITMASSEEAALCIDKLNHTELHGRMIAVEKTTREPSGTIKRADLQAIQNKATLKKSEKIEAGSKGAKKETAEKGLVKTEDSKTEKPKSDKPKVNEKIDKPKPEKKDETVADGEKPKDEKPKDDAESSKEEGPEGKKEGKRDSSKEREGRSRDRSRERRKYRDRRSRSRERYNIRGGFFNRGFRRGYGFRSYNNRGSYLDHHSSRERERLREDSPPRRFSADFRQREIERKNKEESLRLERERERLRIEREKLERERAEVLRLEREKQRFERERLERERAELRKRSSMTLDERRGLKRNFDEKDIDFFLSDRKRRREPSLEPSDSFRDFGRDRGSFSDRRGDRFEGRGKGGSPPFSGRREGRHDHDSFSGRSRNSRDGERGRDDWKGKSGRDRNFDRGSRSSFNERGGRTFERPHPWESGAPDRDQSAPSVGGSQWAPVNKPAENWGRIEPPPQERWGNLEHNRGPPAINLGHPPNIGPPNPMVFAAPGTEMIPPMGGHFPVDRFNTGLIRRF